MCGGLFFWGGGGGGLVGVSWERIGGSLEQIHSRGEIVSMKLPGLDHSQLKVKVGRPPHFKLLMSEMLLLRNLLACAPDTPKDKIQPLWSEELQSAERDVGTTDMAKTVQTAQSG